MPKNVLEGFTVGGYTYESRLINCGKSQCSKCPHGPYWYLIMNLRTGKKVTKYIGKSLPQGVQKP